MAHSIKVSRGKRNRGRRRINQVVAGCERMSLHHLDPAARARHGDRVWVPREVPVRHTGRPGWSGLAPVQPSGSCRTGVRDGRVDYLQPVQGLLGEAAVNHPPGAGMLAMAMPLTDRARTTLTKMPAGNLAPPPRRTLLASSCSIRRCCSSTICHKPKFPVVQARFGVEWRQAT